MMWSCCEGTATVRPARRSSGAIGTGRTGHVWEFWPQCTWCGSGLSYLWWAVQVVR